MQLTPLMPLWRFRNVAPVYATDVAISNFADISTPVRNAMDTKHGIHRIRYTGTSPVTLGNPSWFVVKDIPGDDCYIIIEAETRTTITDGMSPNGFSNIIWKNFDFNQADGIRALTMTSKNGERIAITAVTYGATTTLTVPGHKRFVGDTVLVRTLAGCIQHQPKYYTVLSVAGDNIEVDL